MIMIEIDALGNGAHNNQTFHGTLPSGWAIVPDDLIIPDTFPFVDIEVEDGVVVSMTAGVVPDANADLTPAQQREQAYNTERIIEWNGDLLTVTEAATLWQYYAAEGSDRAPELQALIAAAKAEIRAKYPDGGAE